MYKTVKKLLLPILLLFFLTGCTDPGPSPEAPLLQVRPYAAVTDTFLGERVENSLADLPTETEPVELRTMANITLADNATTVSDDENSSVFLSGNVVMITSAGRYRLTGTLTNGQIWVSAEGSVCLVLDGVNVNCNTMPAVELHGSGDKVITLAEGSENYLSDGDTRSSSSLEKDGVVTFINTLTVNGAGSLTVSSHFAHAFSVGKLIVSGTTVTVSETVGSALQSTDHIIVSHSIVRAPFEAKGMSSATVCLSDSTIKTGGIAADVLSVERCDLLINAKGDGLSGKTIVSIADSAVRITATGDGIVSYDADSGKGGIVRLVSSDAVVCDGDDGIKAEYLLCPSGTLFSYGKSAQLNLVGAVTYVVPTDVILYSPLTEGELVCGKKRVTLSSECGCFTYVGPTTEDGYLYLNGEKYALLW